MKNQNRERLETAVQALRIAIFDKDPEATEKTKRKLVSLTAMVLINQDTPALRFLQGKFANLALLAEQENNPEQSGDRFEILGDLVRACADTNTPLNRIRLADKGTATGEIFHYISKSEGCGSKKVKKTFNLTKAQTHELITQLDDIGLINRAGKKKGYWRMLFVTKSGRELMEFFKRQT